LREEQKSRESQTLFKVEAKKICEEEIMKELFELGCVACGAFFCLSF